MKNKRYNYVVVQTPEGVTFTSQLASPVSRFIALAVDIGVIWTAMSFVGISVTLLQWVSYDFAMAFYILLYFTFNLGYFILLEMIWRGQTIGKRMMRLRVQDVHGLKLQPAQLVLRNLLRFVDSLPVLYFVGGTASLLSPRSQRLGDLAAGTIVVRIPQLEPPVLSELSENSFNSFREHPRLEALLRQRVPPEEAELALQSLRRRNEMEPLARTRLFRELAEHLREKVRFPEELHESMSDEQYVRNCVDTLYRAAR